MLKMLNQGLAVMALEILFTVMAIDMLIAGNFNKHEFSILDNAIRG